MRMPPCVFQSTLPLRGATDKMQLTEATENISIHAPLTGSDDGPMGHATHAAHFNPRSPYGERPVIDAAVEEETGISIHAPLTGSDILALRTLQRHYIFQSTLPLRGATSIVWTSERKKHISIHAPLTGSDR